jgi:hypothetical protein
MRTGNNHYGCLLKVYTTDIVAANQEKLYPSEDLMVRSRNFPHIDDTQLVKWTKSQQTIFIRDNIVLIEQVIHQFVGKIVANAKAGSLHSTFPLIYI